MNRNLLASLCSTAAISLKLEQTFKLSLEDLEDRHANYSVVGCKNQN